VGERSGRCAADEVHVAPAGRRLCPGLASPSCPLAFRKAADDGKATCAFDSGNSRSPSGLGTCGRSLAAGGQLLDVTRWTSRRMSSSAVRLDGLVRRRHVGRAARTLRRGVRPREAVNPGKPFGVVGRTNGAQPPAATVRRARYGPVAVREAWPGAAPVFGGARVPARALADERPRRPGAAPVFGEARVAWPWRAEAQRRKGNHDLTSCALVADSALQ
jgi:hypothetical protein